MENSISANQTGPITLSDVRMVLGEVDPKTTNAGTLRSKLGRGSNATIQKHLDALRVEMSHIADLPTGTTPAAPADAVTLIWSAAYSAAQLLTLGRLEKVTAAREQLQSVCDQQSADLAAALAEVDSKTSEAGAKEAEAAEKSNRDELEKAELLKNAATNDALREAAKTDLEAFKIAAEAAFGSLKLKADSDLTITRKNAQIAAQTLQATIDRLTDQVGELKSLLHRQVQLPVAAFTAAEP